MTPLKEISMTSRTVKQFDSPSQSALFPKPGAFLPNIHKLDIRIGIIEEIDDVDELSKVGEVCEIPKTSFVTPKHQKTKGLSLITTNQLPLDHIKLDKQSPTELPPTSGAFKLSDKIKEREIQRNLAKMQFLTKPTYVKPSSPRGSVSIVDETEQDSAPKIR